MNNLTVRGVARPPGARPPLQWRVIAPGHWFGKPHADETTWCAVSNGRRIVAMFETRDEADRYAGWAAVASPEDLSDRLMLG